MYSGCEHFVKYMCSKYLLPLYSREEWQWGESRQKEKERKEKVGERQRQGETDRERQTQRETSNCPANLLKRLRFPHCL